MGGNMLPVLLFARAIWIAEAIVGSTVAMGCIQEITICHIVHSFRPGQINTGLEFQSDLIARQSP
ncbi:hypothetical protein CPY51_08055 [Rhizobium tubonense]|uniref:Uncharacterized protein n=1 Tax=Rhizobium tubonense TaxID=484088 RepID=A0A2W4EXY4_9HYPH|nr:hypothetical protein CPY51_08055 [Rhizobium tubonense]